MPNASASLVNHPKHRFVADKDATISKIVTVMVYESANLSKPAELINFIMFMSPSGR